MGPLRRVASAIAAVLLLLALVPPARANAVDPYDAAFLGESAFLTLGPGQSGMFSVFWGNVGSTEWTPNGVVLAVCKPDKASCDQSDATTAAFASGWLSSTRYAHAAQDSVPPGKVGTFTYSVKAPASAAAGTYHFYGALWDVFGRTAIHNVGYFQDATVTAASAATLTSLAPDSGSDAGADTVTIAGAGFVCAPSPAVTFDVSAARVLECGATSLKVTTPAHAAGAVNVTVTNAQAVASNALAYTYVDRTPPTFDSIDVVGQSVTLHFSEPVCVSGSTIATSGGESVVRVNATDAGAAGDVTDDEITFADCDSEAASSTALVQLDPTKLLIAQGDQVSVTLLAAGIAKIQDAGGNLVAAAQTRSAAALADTTPPSISSAEIVSSTKLRVTWSEDMKCSITVEPSFSFRSSSGSTRTNTGTTCSGSYGATTTLVTFASGSFTTSTSGTLTYDPAQATSSARVVDTAGNPAARQAIAAASYSPATITSASVDTDTGSRNIADVGDVFRLTFSKDMEDTANSSSAQLWIEDSDGTAVIVRCDPTANGADGYIAAACLRDPDATGTLREFSVTLKEATNVSSDTQSFGTAGLAWPATIAAVTGWIPQPLSDLKPVDLDASADTTID